jgi:hypothetical protein
VVVILGDAFEHYKHVNVPETSFKSANKTLKKGLYKDENEVLYCFVHKKAKEKTDYYNKKISEMETKYKTDFFTFENRIYLKVREKNLEEWNDFILWGGYVKAYRYWKQFC